MAGTPPAPPKLDGYAVVISELENELDYLRRALPLRGGALGL
jgi:hypothetical protein